MSSLLEIMRSTSSLPTLPAIALELMKLLRDRDVPIERLVGVIQKDPSLCGRLLKLVNSSMFGVRRSVSSVRQATVILGIRAVKTMSLSFCIVDTVGAAKRGRFDQGEYWGHSLTVATTARVLAKATDFGDPEQAFVAGLLADIGIFAAMRVCEAQYAPVFESAESDRRKLCEVESSAFGGTHAEFSDALLHAWGLPPVICEAARRHHDADSSAAPADARALVALIQASEQVTQLLRDRGRAGELEPVLIACGERLGVDPEKLDNALPQVSAAVREMATLLSLNVTQPADYELLRAEAAAKLAELSMESETECAMAQRRELEAREAAQRLETENRVIARSAATDTLTKLANRAAFDEALAESLRQAAKAGAPLSLLMIDVDHFKKLNDTYGHPAGDEVLRQVGSCLSEIATGTRLAARYGGEEFAVIAEATVGNELRALAESIRAGIESRSIAYDGRQMRVTASIGAATITPTPDLLPERFVKLADQQLYAAKRNGRNRVESAA